MVFGFGVGATVGFGVGAAVGFGVGAAVGFGVGAAVGFGIGAAAAQRDILPSSALGCRRVCRWPVAASVHIEPSVSMQHLGEEQRVRGS